MTGGNAALGQVTLDPAWPENPKTFGGESSDEAYSVQETSDGGHIVVGETSSFGEIQGDVYLIKLAPPGRHFLHGDCNGDGSTAGVKDALDMLTANFIGGVEIPCLAACDVNGNGDVTGVQDALELLTYNFSGGVTIPAPFPDCELSSPDPLGCEIPLECR